MISPAIPDPRNTTTNATYQRTADRTSLNTSAPSGARIPQRPTPPESRNPPSGIIDSVGASRMSTWPTRSSHGKSRVREKTTIAPSRTPKYTSGTTPTGDPNARYSAPHSAATGRISTEIRTSSALRARRSSSSRGSAPTCARRAVTRSATARIRSRTCIAGDVTRGSSASATAGTRNSGVLPCSPSRLPGPASRRETGGRVPPCATRRGCGPTALRGPALGRLLGRRGRARSLPALGRAFRSRAPRRRRSRRRGRSPSSGARSRSDHACRASRGGPRSRRRRPRRRSSPGARAARRSR